MANHYCELFVWNLTKNSMLAVNVSMLMATITTLIIPAYPLAYLFGKRAYLAGAAIGWPLLAIFLWHASNATATGDTKILVMSFASLVGLIYWSALTLGAWLASRIWPNSVIKN
jgi:hypothetical protein